MRPKRKEEDLGKEGDSDEKGDSEKEEGLEEKNDLEEEGQPRSPPSLPRKGSGYHHQAWHGSNARLSR